MTTLDGYINTRRLEKSCEITMVSNKKENKKQVANEKRKWIKTRI